MLMRLFKTGLICASLTIFMAAPATAQLANPDSVKAELNKIELLNGSMKQTIDKYKKNILKTGDLESMTLLGIECMNGKNVKGNMTIGLNLIETAAKQDYVDAQYNMGNYFYMFWQLKKENDVYFRQGTNWLKKAIKAGDLRSQLVMAQFYNSYGIYKKQDTYVEGALKLLETIPSVDEVNDQDDYILDAQAMIGDICLAKWKNEQDTAAVRNAKKYYRLLLTSKKQYPTYSKYIDSLKLVLSSGVPLRIDPMPTQEEIDAQAAAAAAGGMGGFPGGGMGGFGGGFPGGGFGGGFPGGGPQAGPQAKFWSKDGQNMNQFISKNTNYPKDLEDQRLKGSATVSFTVDVDGSVINPTVSREAEVHLMNQEALRTVMIMPDFIPAEQDGVKVQSQQSANVNFGSGGGMGGMMMF